VGAWLKLFNDGSHEHGSDQLIAAGKASWTNGRLSDIAEVRLTNLRQTVSLSVPDTSWHQFDRFIVELAHGTQRSQVTHRVVQAEIKASVLGQYVICSKSGSHFFWTLVGKAEATRTNSFFSKLITERHVGKWLTLVLPENDYPSITFSTRGKMNDN